MKVYVVTMEVENIDIGTGIEVIAVKSNEKDAQIKIQELFKEFKSEYDIDNVKYNVHNSSKNYICIDSANGCCGDYEHITLQYKEMEVE